jgi:hypothetical protein
VVDCCLLSLFVSHIVLLSFSGNWDPKTQDARYSAKMPSLALRVIAGFSQDEIYSIRRSHIVPCQELQEMIFPFLEAEMATVEAAVNDDKKERPTATCTLRLWVKLRSIILQDAAEIAVMHPERFLEHHLFRMEVFHTDLFKVSLVSFLFLFCLIVAFTNSSSSSSRHLSRRCGHSYRRSRTHWSGQV